MPVSNNLINRRSNKSPVGDFGDADCNTPFEIIIH